MTALRTCAYIQRDNRNDIKNPNQVEGHELDWLAETLTDCQDWQVITKPGEGEGEPQASDAVTMEVMKTRASLAKMTVDWQLDIRVTAEALQVVVEATINEISTKMTLAPEVKETFEWNIPVKARLKYGAMEFGNITLKLEWLRDENSNWGAWAIEKGELEAVLSLWVFSLTKLVRRQESMDQLPLKKVWLLDLDTPEVIINHRLWINRGTTPKATPLGPQTLYFGWTGASNVDSGPVPGSHPQRYLAVDRAGPLVSVCAQSLYTSFLFNLACKVINVGGITARRTEEPTTGDVDEDPWSRFRLNNSNLASLAVIYNQSLRGTLETAYFSIIPAFSAAKILPYPHEAYNEASAESAKLSRNIGIRQLKSIYGFTETPRQRASTHRISPLLVGKFLVASSR